MSNYLSAHKLFSLKIAKRLLLGIFIVFVFDYSFFAIPALASAQIDDNLQQINANIIMESEKAIENNSLNTNTDYNSFPNNDYKDFKNIGYFTLTAYTSEVAQCDASPCITANGFNVCKHKIEDTVAVNFLPFGTKIRIPDLFGDRIFIVRDRMNQRFQKTLDIWMVDKSKAIKFGVKVAKIEVMEP